MLIENDSASYTVKQLNSQFRFQRSNQFADVRLARVQFLGCQGHIQRFRQADKCA